MHTYLPHLTYIILVVTFFRTRCVRTCLE